MKLTWDSPYAVALRLIEYHPDADLEQVSLNMVYAWTLALPDFDDEPELANDVILAAIYQEWYEEVNPV